MKTKLIILAAVLLATQESPLQRYITMDSFSVAGKRPIIGLIMSSVLRNFSKSLINLKMKHCAKKTIDNNEPLLEDANRP